MHVLLLAFLLAGQDQAPLTCTLSGSVVNAATGAPLTKVELQAERTDDSKAPIAATTTDAAGAFTLVNLPAGHYRLKGMRNGFLDTYFGARHAAGNGTNITLDPGQQMKDVEIRMFPFGVIAGTVRDADGEPMAGATIKLFRQTWDDNGRRSLSSEAEGVTDDLGQYRITHLEPGKYYVRADRRSDEEYGVHTPVDHSAKPDGPPAVLLPTLYPGTIDPAAARTVDVGSGSRVAGIDITLMRSRVFRVTLRVSAAPGLAGKAVWLESAPGFEGLGPRPRGQSQGDTDEFEIRGVPPGSYTLMARADPYPSPKWEVPGRMTIDFFRRQYEARVPLTVAGDMEGVRVAIGTGTEVTGHVTFEKADKKPEAGAGITSDPGGFTIDHADSFEDGTVRFIGMTGRVEHHTPILEDQTFSTGLYPDRYHVYARRKGMVIRSIRADGVDVFSDGVLVGDGGRPAIEIVLAPDGGKVDGVVLDKDDKPAGGATVLLVAEPKLRSRIDSFLEATTDQYGRYHFDNVRPGDYKVFAWDDLESHAWFEPDFFKDVESKGEPVTLSAAGHAAAQVHVLSAR